MISDATLQLLEFTQIREQLCEHCHTPAARNRAQSLVPYTDANALARAAAATTSARRIYDAMGSAPIYSMDGLEDLTHLLHSGRTLSAGQLHAVAEFLKHCRLLSRYLERARTIDALVAGYGASIDPLEALRAELDRCIRVDLVDENASSTLRSLRRSQETLSGRIKDKCASLLRNHPQWFQEAYVSQRGGRYVLPVKREYRAQVKGSVRDASSSGATVFVEPDSVASLQQELDLARIDEENEVLRILSTLSAQVGEAARSLSINAEVMAEVDYVFACAKLGGAMDGVTAQPTARRSLSLVSARHPLLGPGAVPLTLELGAVRGLIITGPNTGGKTVALKTVGLITLMALCGLQVPAEQAVIPLFEGVYCDIGDGQSIAQNLSTFSSHVRRVADILQEANGRSLVLLDELGSGTDPQEGMGLAVAVLEELGRRHCLMVVTSHYAEIKVFAAQTPGFQNARMTFDRTTLRPLYELRMGEAGESCALYIAQRLGIPQPLLLRAWQAAYPEDDGQPPLAEPSPPAGDAAASPKAPSPAVEAPPRPADGQTPPLPEPLSGAEAGPADTSAETLADMPMPDAPPARKTPYGAQFQLGDCVFIPSMNCRGLVCKTRNARGEIGVRIRGKNFTLHEKRLKPFLKAEALYPDAENYDLDIVLDSVPNRKAKRDIRKGKPGVQVVLDPGREGD